MPIYICISFLIFSGCYWNSKITDLNSTTATAAPAPVCESQTFTKLMASTALRDAGVQVISKITEGQNTSYQLTLDAEVTTYAGANFPTTSGYNYRIIPNVNTDDEGYSGTTCKYAPRPTVNCGSSGSIAARIADCADASKNGSLATWDGSTQCSGGQGTWKLVTLVAANKEVWQDQRTGLLWSSEVTGGAGINWCRASGNIQSAPLTFINAFNNTAGTAITGNGTIGSMSSGTASNTETITVTFTSSTNFTVTGTGGAGGCQGGGPLVIGAGAGSTVTYTDVNECTFTITQGTIPFANNDRFTLQNVADGTFSCLPNAASGLQPLAPISYCAEASGLNPPGGETWVDGGYATAKGNLGKQTSPSVIWRLPTSNDYQQANLNGIRFVMPDLGIDGPNRPTADTSTGSTTTQYEWTSSLISDARTNAGVFSTAYGGIGPALRSSARWVRCVGR